MTITKLFPSGAIEISGIINGHLVSRVYYDYSRKEAIELFKQETKSNP